MNKFEPIIKNFTRGWGRAKQIIQENTTLNLQVGKGAVPPPRIVKRDHLKEDPSILAKHLVLKEESLVNYKNVDKEFMTHEPMAYFEHKHPANDEKNLFYYSFNDLPPQPILHVVEFEAGEYDPKTDFALPLSEINKE